MRFMHKLSYCMAYGLSRSLGENHSRRGVYYYGLQIITGTVFKLAALALASLILGTFREIVIILAFFILLRSFAGGVHMDTYGKCFAVSSVLFVILSIIANQAGAYMRLIFETNSETAAFAGIPDIALLLIIAEFAAGVLILLKWAPADTPNKPITNKSKIKSLKAASLLYMAIWLIIQGLSAKAGYYAVFASGITGTALALFIATPAAYMFFGRLAGKTLHR